MSTYEENVEKANIGADFETFVRGNVGSYLVARAELDEIKVLRKLAQTPADDKESIYKLQLKANVRKKLIEYIAEVIQAGKTAQWELEQNAETY